MKVLENLANPAIIDLLEKASDTYYKAELDDIK